MAASSSPDRAARLAPWIGGLALALPVLLIHYPPMSDLPLHEASVGLLRHWGDTKFAPPSIYFVNLGHANQLFSFLDYALSWVVPIRWASKIVVASGILGLSIAAAHFADHLAAPRWTALLVAPVGLGWLFFWGLIQNILGLVALLAILPAIDRFAARPTGRAAAWMCGAMVLLHFAHEAMQLVALMALVLCSAASSLRDVRGVALRLVPVAFCGVLVCAANVYAWHFAGPLHRATYEFQWTGTLYKLAEIPGVLFAGYEAYVRNLMMLLVLVPVALLGVDRVRGRRRAARWGERLHEWRFELMALLLFAIYLAAPATVKSTTLVYHRFLPPAWSILAVTSASRTAAVARLLPRLLCATAPVASLLTSWPVLLDAHHVYSDLDALLPYVEVGSSIATLDMGPDPPNRLWSPMVAAGHVVAVRGGRSIFDYTQSPVSPVTQRSSKIWIEPVLRVEAHTYDFIPQWDFTRFRYVFVNTPKVNRAVAITYCMRDSARLIASQGDWYLFESTLQVVPIDAHDAAPPSPRPPTIQEALKIAAEELNGPDKAEQTPPTASAP